MRVLYLTAGALALAFLPGCAAYQTEATEPTVSYTYSDDDDYDEVAEKAEDYCDDHYDQDAYLVDEDREGSGYEATFACR